MGRYEPKKLHQEFELDLAPLLAVMVKLVPVLIVSSAFVQVSIVETDLPQVVKEEIQKQSDNPNPPAQVIMTVNQDMSTVIAVISSGTITKQEFKATSDGTLDLKAIHSEFIKIKGSHPGTYKLELKPQPKVPYDTLVKIMDEARKTKDGTTMFPVVKDGKEITKTPYMFPDVVFANVIEG